MDSEENMIFKCIALTVLFLCFFWVIGLPAPSSKVLDTVPSSRPTASSHSAAAASVVTALGRKPSPLPDAAFVGRLEAWMVNGSWLMVDEPPVTHAP